MTAYKGKSKNKMRTKWDRRRRRRRRRKKRGSQMQSNDVRWLAFLNC
jgi:hypothetical protein